MNSYVLHQDYSYIQSSPLQALDTRDVEIDVADIFYRVLPQHPYQSKGSYVRQPPVRFSKNNTGFVVLQDALEENLEGLEGRDEEAFIGAAKMAMKQHFRLLLEDYPPYGRQFTSRRSCAHAGSITIGKLATQVAKQMAKFMEMNRCSAKLQLDRLVLVELRHVSKSSWQPLLGVLV